MFLDYPISSLRYSHDPKLCLPPFLLVGSQPHRPIRVPQPWEGGRSGREGISNT